MEQDLTPDQVKKFDEDIVFMENLVKVYTWDSCNQIRALLSFKGKMRASEISEQVGLEGDKSVYKSLKRLIDAGLIQKELEEGSQRNAYYHVSVNKTEDPDFSPEFITYLIAQNKYGLISDYLTAANQASMGFLQVMSDLMKEKIVTSQDPDVGTEYIDNTMFLEIILSIEDPKLLINRIRSLIQQEFPKYLANENDPRLGIKNPAAFYLAFVPLPNTRDR